MEKNGLLVDAVKVMKEASKRPLLLPEPRPRLRIVFHPGSGGAQKNHAPEFWMNLVRVFERRLSHQRITSGPPWASRGKASPLFSREKEVEIILSPDTPGFLYFSRKPHFTWA